MIGKTLCRYSIDDIEVARDLVDEEGNYRFYAISEHMKELYLE